MKKVHRFICDRAGAVDCDIRGRGLRADRRRRLGVSDAGGRIGVELIAQPFGRNQRLDEEETDAYWVRSLSFPSIGENGQKDNLVTALYYQSKTPGKKKLVIVLPIWGSHTYPSDTIAAGLVEHGRGETHVLNFLGEDHLFDWAGMEKASSEQDLARMMKQMTLRVGAPL
jgi:hypothetical protein